ncbi:MAG: membrane dipeptidase, partial [Halobacteriales archaeon]|nr:membrane dipeptidase [Halobacteriales archaeon]
LTEAEEDRVEGIIDRDLVISLHDHPAYLPRDVTDRVEYTRDGRVVTPYDALADSPLDAIFVSPMGSKTWDESIRNLGMRRSDIAHQELVTVGESVADLLEANEQDQIAFVFGFETSMLIENELDRLDILYGLGVRTLGVTYSEANALGSGLAEPRDGGLTKFGHEAIERMNKLGILIDCSHASDQTTLDVCQASEKPVILSHNGAQSLLPIQRLDPDEVMQAVADTGGVIGIQAAPHTTSSPEHGRHSIDSMMDHFEYVKDLVGIDHVTFGPDAFYGDHVALHLEVFNKDLTQFPEWLETDITHVKGVDNPTEGWHNFIRALVKRGYSDEEIEKVLGGNTLRVLREVW